MSLQTSNPSISSLTSEVAMTPITGFWPGCQAPDFRDVPCLQGGVATTLPLSSLQGGAVLLLFHPVDFGYIGPTELELVERLGSNCRVVAVSTGSLVGKKAFLNTPRCPLPPIHTRRSEGGGQGLAITMVEDRCGAIARAFGVSDEGSSYRWVVTLLTDPSYRAMVLLDTRGEVVVRQVGDLPSGLGLGEVARLVREQQVAATPGVQEQGESEVVDQMVGTYGAQQEVFRGQRSEASSKAGGREQEALVVEGSSSEEQKVGSVIL